MYTLKVNGSIVYCETNKKLLNFLREDLCLTSVKNGCGEGVCGTCTVLVNGKAMKSCIFTLDKLEGKDILTVEGLTPRQKDVYAYAFGKAGAVQCGFCIPGMVIAAQSLLNQNTDPTDDEIRKAIRGNICRCTGYAKILDAIRLAAKMFREETEIPDQQFSGMLGEDFPRLDAREKTLGTGQYVDDIVVPGMLYASALRTPYPRAKVLSINFDKALKHPDCVRVLTARDVPGNIKIGHLEFISDYDVLIAEGGITRFIGDGVAVVVSKTRHSLQAIKDLVQVEYEELEAMMNPAEALREDAPKIHEKGNILSHEHLIRGNADEALKQSKYVVTKHYSVPFTDHAFMEPECAIAMPEGEDGLLLYTAGQSIYDEQREISRMLGVAPDKIHVQGKLVGGGFGGKEDMSVQHHAALAAWHTKKPVKVLFTRKESLWVHPKRHAMEMDFTTGCDENGNLTAMKAFLIANTGAYASLGGPVLQRACTHAAGPYNYQHIDIEGTAVYTNCIPAGAFRGFGVPQSAFATENNLNLLAEMVGISPWEIRYKNAIRPGQVLPNGQIANNNTALDKCLLAVKDAYENGKNAGISSFFKNSGLGVGIPDTGRCTVSVEGKKVHVRTSAACIGQGMATVCLQIACETLNLPPEWIVVEPPDTRRTPNAGTTTASRQTLLTGEALRLSAARLKEKLDEGAATGKSLENILIELEGEEFYSEYCPPTDPMGSDKDYPVSHVAYGYAAEVITLDDEGRVDNVVAAYDMGRVVNPKSAEGQIEGGIVMGLGYALTEDFFEKDGHPALSYGKLGLWRADQVPPMKIILVQSDDMTDQPAYGVKGCGELATIPTAPAVSGAYYALDGILRTKLPMENTYYRKKK